MSTTRIDLGELHAVHFGRLTRFCRAFTRCEAEAQDIAQEALVRAYEQRHRFDEARPVWPWLRTIARNLALNAADRKGRERPLEDARPPTDDPELERVEDRHTLELALARLPRRQREAIDLRYLQDREPQEAAEALDMSLAAFNQLVYRARGRLRVEVQRILGVPVVAVWCAVAAARDRLRRLTARPGADPGLLAASTEGIRQATAAAVVLLVAATTVGLGVPWQGAGRAAERAPVELWASAETGSRLRPAAAAVSAPVPARGPVTRAAAAAAGPPSPPGAPSGSAAAGAVERTPSASSPTPGSGAEQEQATTPRPPQDADVAPSDGASSVPQRATLLDQPPEPPRNRSDLSPSLPEEAPLPPPSRSSAGPLPQGLGELVEPDDLPVGDEPVAQVIDEASEPIADVADPILGPSDGPPPDPLRAGGEPDAG